MKRHLKNHQSNNLWNRKAFASQLTLLPLLLLLFSTCKREFSGPTYSGIYSPAEAYHEECFYVYPSADGSILALSRTSDIDAKGILLSKYLESGKREWVKTIPTTGKGGFVNPISNGGLIITSDYGDNRLIKLNNKGEVIFNTLITDSVHPGYSYSIEAENKHIFTLYFKGFLYDNMNKILEFDENGMFLKNETLTIYENTFFGGSTEMQGLYKVQLPGTFYFCGVIYPTGIDMYKMNPHLFVSRIEFENKKMLNKKTVLLDKDNETEINNGGSLIYLNTTDNKLVLINAQKEARQNTITRITKVDENMNKVWDFKLSLGIGNTFPFSMRMCPDGNYLIGGQCNVSGISLSQPFAAKVSSDGQLLWSKIYPMTQNSRITSGFQNNDGSINMGGNTFSFGGGLNLNDLFIMKTDENGNLK